MDNLIKQPFALKVNYSLVKSEQGGKKGIATLKGTLSTQNRDTEGEMVIIKGMDITALNSGYAQINWWHLGRKDPKMVVGLIDNAHKNEDNTAIHFEGHLLNTESGKAAYELMQALEAEGKEIGVSVEGSVIARNNGNIYRSIATGAALATDQINKDCTARLCKALMDNNYESSEDLSYKDLYKAISVEGDAIYGQNPVTAPSLAFSYNLDEAVARLKKLYPDLATDFIRNILITINKRNNE